MTHSIARESLIPLREAAKHIPGRPHISTLHRWRLRGIRGRKLETILCGGRRFTSLEAIHRFLNPSSAPVETIAGQRSRADAAGQVLKNLGL